MLIKLKSCVFVCDFKLISKNFDGGMGLPVFVQKKVLCVCERVVVVVVVVVCVGVRVCVCVS
jgi:hypothetical protein